MAAQLSSALPRRACDTHTHVFGPLARFPFRAETNYAPPDSPFEAHAAMLAKIGFDRAVLIQPIPYQTDNSAILDAVARAGGRLKGVGVQTSAATDSELTALRDGGICALRFMEMTNPNGTGRYKGAVGVGELEKLAPRMRARGLHAQIWADNKTCVALAQSLKPLGLPIVFDHMAGIDVTRGVEAPEFQALLKLVAGGDIWVKLTVCRVSKTRPNDYADVRPFHEALVRENPQRLLYGSDFPFVRMEDRMPDVERLAELFLAWTPAAVQAQILTENPRALFGFDDN